ncbi:MAG: PAS domain-containing protein [Myxococcales bacterium]|nr:PAS domain-containing protein [Myxococcales bacterium]
MTEPMQDTRRALAVGAACIALAALASGAVLVVRDLLGSVQALGLVALLSWSGFVAFGTRRGRQEDHGAEERDARIAQLAARNAALECALVERCEMAETLRRMQADLATAQRLAKIGTWRWSIVRDEFIEVSQEFARIHGVDAGEIAALLRHQVDRFVHPDDRSRVRQAFRAFDESGERYEIDYRIVRPDGEARHVFEIGESILGATGRPVEVTGTLQDITEEHQIEESLQRAHEALEARVEVRTAELRKLNAALTAEIAERERAEEASREREILLRTAARVANLGYAVWDEQAQKYANVSEEYARLFGLTAEDFLARYCNYDMDLQTIHPDDRERYQAFDRAYRAAPVETEVELRLLRPDGEIRHARELMQPVFDASGRLVQSILAVQDITSLKHTEEQLRQAQKMEAVGQLTGGVAHDFNNLLAVILGNLELAEGEIGAGAEAREWIQAAIRAAERGANLTQRLLAFSRRQALHPEPVDANQLVQSLLDLLRRTLGAAIEIELSESADLWLSRVDRSQLENAILNLAINARDAMPGGGKLAIHTSNVCIDDDYALAHTQLSPGHYVLVTVRDTGVGIAEKVLDHVFEPFYTTKDVGEGSGLGLSMVYGFVKQSGGHISIDSEEGQGTTVQIYLPRYHGSDPAGVECEEVPAFTQVRSEVVMLVDDDADLRALIRQMLETLGYAVREAAAGPAALELLGSDQRFDLLLTDIVLPGGMSGRELAEAARRSRPQLPVLCMSGYTEDAVFQQGELDEGIRFLQKPFRLAEIARVIRAALGAAAH